MGAQVVTISTDTEFVHLAWRRDKSELNDLPFPMLSDVKRELAASLGIESCFIKDDIIIVRRS